MAKTAIGKRRVTFSLTAPGATAVFLAGDFNNWDENFPMDMKPNGKCSKTLMLAPGRYEYKFKVDGHWRCDPENQAQCDNVHGTTNSVIIVSPGK